MTDRERFRRVMAYEPVDRLPVMALEPYEAEALERWRTRGLPGRRRPWSSTWAWRGCSGCPLNFGPSRG